MLSGDHAHELGLAQERDAEFTCACEFRAGILADQDKMNILADTGGDLAAVLFDELARFIPR